MGDVVRDELMRPVDVAVIGSGIAGLFLAHRCVQKGLNVALITLWWTGFIFLKAS